jgi:hypothetical protein
MRSKRRSSRSAVAFFITPENSGSLRHSVIVSGLIPATRLASSSVSPITIASAILAITSGVRLVGRPSPSLPRLLMVCAGSLFMPSCHFSFFVRPGNNVRFPRGCSQDGAAQVHACYAIVGFRAMLSSRRTREHFGRRASERSLSARYSLPPEKSASKRIRRHHRLCFWDGGPALSCSPAP